MQTNITDRELDWPARAYVYGTFGYALKEAIARARKHRQKMFLYKGILDDDPVWISAWDPKPGTPSLSERVDRAVKLKGL